jgi:prepilin peptidase CpaA
MVYKHFDIAIDTALIVWTLTLTFTVCAGWIDWRSRRIPNWLTVPGFLMGLVLRSVIGGWHGTLSSLEGAALGLSLLLPLVLLRGLGAGDWKLMGAVGAFLGPWGLLMVLFVSILVSGVMAVLTMIHARKVVTTLRNMVVLVQGFFVFGWRGNSQITLDNPGLLKLPFGVATALATLICFIVSRWIR